MATLKIFISHSSKTEKRRKQLLEIKKGLELGGFTVLADTNLNAGERWFDKLHEWMFDCDAAIILFSKQSKERPWVRAESAILSNRQRNDEDSFKLIPVALDNISDDDLDHDDFYKALRITDFQFFKTCRNKGWFVRQTASNTEIVEELVRQLSEHNFNPGNTPFNRLVVYIRSALIDTEIELLKLAAADLNIDPAKSGGTKEQIIRAIAEKIVLHEPGKTSNALEQTRRLLHSIDAQNNSNATRLIKYVRHLWVNPETSEQFKTHDNLKQLVALNGQNFEQFTAESVVRSCWPEPNEITFIKLDEASIQNSDQIFTQILNTIAPQFDGNPDIQKQILGSEQQPVVAVFPNQIEGELSWDKALFDDFTDKDEFNKITFILPTGEPHDSETQNQHLLPDNAIQLSPQIDSNDELSQYVQFSKLERKFSNSGN